MTMMLTLTADSLRTLLNKKGANGITLYDVPDFTSEELDLRALNVPASLLVGWSIEDMDRLRDRADKAGCPCLVLYDRTPLDFVTDEGSEDAILRTRRLATAANRLGCNAVSVPCAGESDEETLDLIAANIKSFMPEFERLELTLLLAPHKGATDDPDMLAALIKRIGGFRIGALPSFAHAAERGDAPSVLRQLAPYSGAMHATVEGFTRGGKHRGYDLAKCVEAVRSVGYVNTLAIDYCGSGDPVKDIITARDQMQQVIEAEV